MALDFSSIAPAALVRLLNSTRLGVAVTERQLYRHRMEAGLRIGDGKECDRIHLLRYARWLAGMLVEKEVKATMPTDKHEQYEQHRKATAKRQSDIAAEGQEIGPIPPVADSNRREACRNDFRLFCETYGRKQEGDRLTGVFYLHWSKDHLKVIRKIEEAVLKGRLMAVAMPRGSGKTWLCLFAVLWATLNGHHKFVTLIGATERVARRLLRRLYNQLERNRLLAEDFPEVCFPIKSLERTPQRAMKQKCQGEYTQMVWTSLELVLPKVKGSAASGTVITCCGLTGGEVRGQTREGPEGEALRPTLVLLDDPQTKASAKSKTQTDERIELLQGDVLGMAGPDKQISGMMPCTVIQPGDMADQILNRDDNPDWNGERTKLIYAWPANETLWEEYANLRADGLRRGDGGAAATEFYRKNKAAMDAGAIVAWPERFPSDCLSALQHAVNLRLRNEDAFAAEYQNEPLKPDAGGEVLSVDEIAAKLNNRQQGTVPTQCTRLAMYIDVHKKLLYWIVLAFEPDFTCYVVDYGAWPGQKSNHFIYRTCRRTLQVVYPKRGEEAAIYAGLADLAERTLTRSWARDDGASLRISLALIDAGYQKDTVERFIRQTRHQGLILPAKGIPITASTKALEEGGDKGQEVGVGYRVTKAQGKHSLRLVLLDSNYWKSFLHARLATPMGERGCLSLPGKSDSAHRLLAEHWTNESPVYTEGRGRKLAEWKQPTHKPDNHWLDAAAGASAAGGILGMALMQRALPRTAKASPPKRKRKSSYL